QRFVRGSHRRPGDRVQDDDVGQLSGSESQRRIFATVQYWDSAGAAGRSGRGGRGPGESVTASLECKPVFEPDIAAGVEHAAGTGNYYAAAAIPALPTVHRRADAVPDQWSVELLRASHPSR